MQTEVAAATTARATEKLAVVNDHVVVTEVDWSWVIVVSSAAANEEQRLSSALVVVEEEAVS